MKVAAYQAPLLPSGSMQAVELIRKQVVRCEEEGVEILCCPEALLGGLADDAPRPFDVAIDLENGQLDVVLAPLASSCVTTIFGFTEISAFGHLYNSAAVFHRGVVAGLYRKRHPAIRRSIYQPGNQTPVFTVGALTFGILICNDSNYPELSRKMALQGAQALFIPTNNGLPPEKADVIADARNIDIARAKEHSVWVIRADVAGRIPKLLSYGSSGIVDPSGTCIQSAQQCAEDLLIVDLNSVPVARSADLL